MRKRLSILGIYIIVSGCINNNVPINKASPTPTVISSPTPVVTTNQTPKPEFDINSVKYSSLVVEGNNDSSIYKRYPSYYYLKFSGDGNLIADTRAPDYKLPFVINLRDIYTYKTLNLAAKIMLDDNTNYTNISWESSDNSVFQVSQDGKITPINPGKANVIVKEKTSGKTLISSEIDITGQRYMPLPYPTGIAEVIISFENLSGVVEDNQGNKLNDVQLIIKPDPGGQENFIPGLLQISSNGFYKFKLLPSGMYYITASKKGYKTVTLRTYGIRANSEQYPNVNKYDFTGENALQKE